MKIVVYLFVYSLFLLLIACATTHVSASNQQAAYINVELGLAYLKQGNNQRAKQKLLIALKQAPHASIVNDALAYFFQNTGDTDRAAYYYQRALQLDPHSGRALNNYGVFLCQTGHATQALFYFQRAASLIGYLNTDKAYENAGYCALSMGNKRLANQYFQKAKRN